ncbi:MAG: hypothetical protein AUI14_18845 [Actinobacteria bacterium 13_2_20CM_2_71_6]|nr:MAG: hypothetical protein AUI14_18845 [Actinobacteria bacterium 13_2_20CM_2_71_6]
MSSTDTVTTAKPSPAAAYDAMAGPPFGTRSWTTQVHQLSGTGRPVPCERSKTRATDWAEPGHTSTVQASNSSWQIISQCTSTALPIQPVTRPFMKTSVGRSDGRSVACPGAAGLGPSGPAKFRVAGRSRASRNVRRRGSAEASTASAAQAGRRVAVPPETHSTTPWTART